MDFDDSDTAIVTVVDDFASWSNTRFDPVQLADPLISGATANPGNDGMSNEEEFIYGTSPLTAEVCPMPDVESQPDQVVVTFDILSANGPDYAGLTRHYSLESASTLVGEVWTAVPGFVDITGADQKESYAAPSGVDTAFFLLKVWLSQP